IRVLCERGPSDSDMVARGSLGETWLRHRRLLLIAVSLEHSCSDEHLPTLTPRCRAVCCAPIREAFRINMYSHDHVPIGFKSVLHLRGYFLPFHPCRRQFVAVLEYLQKGRVILFFDPIGSHGGRRSVMFSHIKLCVPR